MTSVARLHARPRFGIAFPNPDGSIGLGLTIVQVPGGAPVHMDVIVSLATINGTWRDSGGRTGGFVFNPALPAPGTPRPSTGGLSGAAVTTVSPGAGLLGGGSTGNVALSVAFGGSGAASSAARSDHTHGLLNFNTSVGDSALPNFATSGSNTAVGSEALRLNTTGSANTAVGREALENNAAGVSNTAVGYQTLRSNTDGVGNTAVGFLALDSTTLGDYNVALGLVALGANTTGNQNTAVGAFALDSATSSSFNVAVGYQALTAASTVNQAVAVGRAALAVLIGPSGGNTAIGDAALGSLTTGSSNVAVGSFAGNNLTNGTGNIYIGTSGGAAAESDTIRIGEPAGFSPATAAYIGGIHGSGVSSATDQPVLVDAAGKLGTVASSARFKQDIATLADTRLLRLRPVSFRYRPEEQRGDALQYGLIAEEVADVMPELVIRDKDGQPISVRYQVLAPLLLAEVQRLEHERTALSERLEALVHEVVALRVVVGH